MSCLPPRDCAYCGLLLAFYDLTSPQNHFPESYITRSRLLDWVMPVAALGITPFNRGTSADCIILLVIQRKKYKTNRHCSDTSWNDEICQPNQKNLSQNLWSSAFIRSILGLLSGIHDQTCFWFVWWITFMIHKTCRNSYPSQQGVFPTPHWIRMSSQSTSQLDSPLCRLPALPLLPFKLLRRLGSSSAFNERPHNTTLSRRKLTSNSWSSTSLLGKLLRAIKVTPGHLCNISLQPKTRIQKQWRKNGRKLNTIQSLQY